METSIPTHHKNVGTLIHLSTFCKYLFPFGNFIAPLILWSAQKRNSLFIDKHGRDAINFQLSILLYFIALAVISIPFFIYFIVSAGEGSASLLNNGYINDPSDFADLGGFLITAIVVGVLAIGLFLIEIITVISAAVQASQGGIYKFPLLINFIQASAVAETPDTQEDSSTQEQPTM